MDKVAAQAIEDIRTMLVCQVTFSRRKKNPEFSGGLSI
jgi:hypothetical protein